jgi:transcription antitermination factor NusG
MPNASHWFVIYTKNLNEKKVAGALERANIVHYAPFYTSLRQWSDRKKKIKVALIPRVIFVNTTEAELAKVYEIPGITGILRQEGKPAKVKPMEIENLKIYLSQENFNPNQGYEFIANEMVEIIEGPFKGIVAQAKKEMGNYRILIEISVIGVNYSLSIPRNQVKKQKNQ